jgi:hypothetical protein
MAEKNKGGKGPKEPKKEEPTNQLPVTLGGEGGGGGDDEDRRLPVMSMEGASEIQAAILLAKKFPRDEAEAQKNILGICELTIFAEGAYYSFPRGRKLDEATGQWKQNIVSGPSIRMAREAARIFGNFRYGFTITHEDDDGRQIVAYAWDVQANNRTTASDYFKKLILRRVGSGPDATTIPVTPDERELRELTNRRASILMRNCILSLMPSYFVDGAVVICKKTVAGGGEKSDLLERVEKMKAAFAELGVSILQIESYLRKPLTEVSAQDLGELRGIYESLAEGVISPQERAEMFSGKETREPPKGPGIDTPTLSEADLKVPGTEPFPIKGAMISQEANIMTGDQRKALMAALRKSKKTLADVTFYMHGKGINVEGPLTEDQYQDAFGFAMFVPPKDPAPAKKQEAAKKEPVVGAAEKANGEAGAETDPKATALKMISEMTHENKLSLRAQVIGLCNAIKGTDNIVEVTMALGKREKEIDAEK